ncbi:methyl-accepting chemotaxis protein [Geomonas sp. RF6]|uniref:methyl-accepting chemotaxis protein n=1 Tax=Geomonas sp. RF6 TaxID=2897342 RepID=UPI002ED8B54B
MRKVTTIRQKITATIISLGGFSIVLLGVLAFIWKSSGLERWRTLSADILILSVMLTAAIGFLYLSLRKRILLLESLREHIAGVTSTWDLSRRLEIDTNDEIGELAREFNVMTEKLAAMVGKINASSQELSGVCSTIQGVSGQVAGAAERQAGAVTETSTAIGQIRESIEEVTRGVDGLSQSAAESTSSILELAASVEEVALNAESLAQSVEEVSSSVGEMTASIKQVKDSASSLMDTANVTSSSIMEMDSSIKQVERNARETAAISEAVRGDAEMGKEAVDAAIAGMQAIKSASHITAEVISNLSQRTGDIGAMLSVIDDVAGQTNLLALNAAIIAAQAGEHGKGFAVVADEIKQLAERTSRSTREIAEVIKGVQEETRRAVQAIGQAERSINEGESLSQKSGEALVKIVSGVQMATAQVESIARATMEQAKGSQMIREAMAQVAEMVRQIASATSEQGKGSAFIMAEVEKMNTLTMQLKNSTREQSHTGHFIAKSTENITEMIQAIKQACDEQSRGSDMILPAVENITTATESNLDGVIVLVDSLGNLAGQIDMLREEIGRFSIASAR